MSGKSTLVEKATLTLQDLTAGGVLTPGEAKTFIDTAIEDSQRKGWSVGWVQKNDGLDERREQLSRDGWVMLTTKLKKARYIDSTTYHVHLVGPGEEKCEGSDEHWVPEWVAAVRSFFDKSPTERQLNAVLDACERDERQARRLESAYRLGGLAALRPLLATL